VPNGTVLRTLTGALLLAALSLSGCASRLKHTESYYPLPFEGEPVVVKDEKGFRLALLPEENRPYIPPPGSIERDEDEAIAPVTQPRDGETTRALAFVIEEPEWTAEPLDEEEGEDKVIFTLRERFYRYLLRTYPHPVRARYAVRRSDTKIQDCRLVSIQVRVTDTKTGYGPVRYFLGYGLGQSRLQIEGEIFEGIERRKIGEFAIRRAHAGYAQSGWNPDVWNDDYVLRYAADEIVIEVVEEIAKHLPAADIVSDADSDVASAPR
jgi:hypothetical protein